MDGLTSAGKPFEISKWEVVEAYRRIKANQGTPGVDGATIEDFEADLTNNLYKIWNRMVRREALRCIPDTVGRNSKGGFWAAQHT